MTFKGAVRECFMCHLKKEKEVSAFQNGEMTREYTENSGLF